MGDLQALGCVTVPVLVIIGLLYGLLYDGNERRRMALGVWRRWMRK